MHPAEPGLSRPDGDDLLGARKWKWPWEAWQATEGCLTAEIRNWRRRPTRHVPEHERRKPAPTTILPLVSRD